MTEDVNTQMVRQPRVHGVHWIVASAVLIVIGFVLWQKWPQKPQTRGAAAQVVRVMKATRGDMPVTLNELGTVSPIATVTVMPNQAVSGYLIDVPFQEGQDVQKEQVLAEID